MTSSRDLKDLSELAAASTETENGPFDSSRFWRWTAVGLGILSIGKGIREPNAWSFTQALIDYRFGFVRRGLFGSIFARPFDLNHYSHFLVFSSALLACLFAALLLLARQAQIANRLPPGEVLAVYSSSFSVAYLAHLNGYLDIPLALLCIGPLFVRSTSWRIIAALVSSAVGMLIHEQFFFSFLPLLVISVLFGAVTGENASKRRIAWVGGAALVALGLGFIGFYAGQRLSLAQTEQLARSIAASTDRPLNWEVFEVLPRTFRENMTLMRAIWTRRTYVPAQIESLLLFVPAAGVISWTTFLVLREWRPRDYRWLYTGVLAATLAPLSLHLLGYDKSRWNELLSLNAFLMLLVVSMTFGRGPLKLPARVRQLCLVAMLLGMASGGGFLDDRHIRPFPFTRSRDQAVPWLIQKQMLPPQ